MSNSDRRILTSQEQYWHAVHSIELLLILQDLVGDLLSHGCPEEDISAEDLQRAVWPEDDGSVARDLLEKISQRRPDFGSEHAALKTVNDGLVELLRQCRGRTFPDVARRVQGHIKTHVATLRSWMVELRSHIEDVTRRPCFEWMEIAATVADPMVDVEGADGRLERIQRICSMLDSVIAMGGMNTWYISKPNDDHQQAPVGVAKPIDEFTVECELDDSKSDELLPGAGTTGEPDTPSTEEPTWKRLILRKQSGGDDLAELDRGEFRINRSVLTFLELLQERKGEMISGATLEKDIGRRPSALYEALPPELQCVIDKPGKGRIGYRML